MSYISVRLFVKLFFIFNLIFLFSESEVMM